MAPAKTAYGLPDAEYGRWMVGPFTVAMTATAAVKRLGCFSDVLFLGLLVGLPDPDGVGSSELKHSSYARQPVALTAHSSNHLTIPRHVRFEVPDCPAVVGLGLYGPDERLEGYGVFRSSRIAWAKPETFDFPSHRILIKRPDRPARGQGAPSIQSSDGLISQPATSRSSR